MDVRILQLGASFRGGTQFFLFVPEVLKRSLEPELDAALHQNALFGVVDALHLPKAVDMGYQVVA